MSAGLLVVAVTAIALILQVICQPFQSKQANRQAIIQFSTQLVTLLLGLLQTWPEISVGRYSIGVLQLLVVGLNLYATSPIAAQLVKLVSVPLLQHLLRRVWISLSGHARDGVRNHNRFWAAMVGLVLMLPVLNVLTLVFYEMNIAETPPTWTNSSADCHNNMSTMFGDASVGSFDRNMPRQACAVQCTAQCEIFQNGSKNGTNAEDGFSNVRLFPPGCFSCDSSEWPQHFDWDLQVCRDCLPPPVVYGTFVLLFAFGCPLVAYGLNWALQTLHRLQDSTDEHAEQTNELIALSMRNPYLAAETASTAAKEAALSGRDSLRNLFVTIGLALNHLQVVAIEMDLGLSWPPEVIRWLRRLCWLVDFDLDFMMSVDLLCTHFYLSVTVQLLVALSFPFVLGFCCFLIAFLPARSALKSHLQALHINARKQAALHSAAGMSEEFIRNSMTDDAVLQVDDVLWACLSPDQQDWLVQYRTFHLVESQMTQLESQMTQVGTLSLPSAKADRITKRLRGDVISGSSLECLIIGPKGTRLPANNEEVTELNFEGQGFSSVEATLVAAATSTLAALNSVTVDSTGDMKDQKTYTLTAAEDKIELSQKNLGRADVALLTAWMQRPEVSAALNEVSIAFNPIGTDGGIALRDALKTSNLKFLTIGKMYKSKDGSTITGSQLTTGVTLCAGGRLGELVKGPNKDFDVKLKWADAGTESGFMKLHSLDGEPLKLPLQSPFEGELLDLAHHKLDPGLVVILSWWLTTEFSAALTKVDVRGNKELDKEAVDALRAAAPETCEIRHESDTKRR
jgi:hypothetical protein